MSYTVCAIRWAVNKKLTLREYISQVGEDHAAKLWGVKKRTVASWRYGQRRPRPEQAQIIVKKSPVTMEGIYGA